MPTIAEMRLELDDALTLKLISQAFTEAAGSKIQKIKKQFEQNGAFYQEMSHVYHLVRIGKGSDAKRGTVAPVNEKILSVAITSNQRFYGNLNVNIMRTFVEEIKKIKTDVLVVGTTGKDFMKSSGYPHPHKDQNFAKDYPTTEETRVFLETTLPYDKVFVYYPKFVTLLTQTVGVIDITQAATQGETVPEDEIHILFEPEYAKILEFFSKQVRSLLFLRVMLESDLSRTAARLITMSAADERSTEIIKMKRSQLRKVQMSIANAKLLETFAGIGGWKK